jgi:hypothetical protein
MDDWGWNHKQVDSIDEENEVPRRVSNEVVAVEQETSYKKSKLEQNEVTEGKMSPFSDVI